MSLKKTVLSIVGNFLFLFMQGTNASAYQENSTGINFLMQRYVYHESNKNGISIQLTNNHTDPYLIESSVIPNNDETNLPLIAPVDTPFIVLPPLKFMSPETTFDWQIKRSGNVFNGVPLPQDREMLFWVAMRAVPPQDIKNDNRQGVSVALTPTFYFKLLYRPKLIASLSVEQIEDKIKIKRDNNFLLIDNQSPLYITFSKIRIGETIIYNDDRVITLAPFMKGKFAIPASASGDIFWALSDEYLLGLKEHHIKDER